MHTDNREISSNQEFELRATTVPNYTDYTDYTGYTGYIDYTDELTGS